MTDQLRILRGQGCQMLDRDNVCRLVTVDWSIRGYPLPYGIGWPRLLDGTRILWDPTDPGSAEEFEVERNGDVLRLKPKDSLSRRGFVGTQVVEAWYQGDSQLPFRLSTRPTFPPVAPRNWTLETPSWSEPPVGKTPLRSIGSVPSATDHVAFAGEDEDAFGFGYTPREALDWLFEKEPAARLSAGQCIASMEFEPSRNVTVGPEVVLPLSETHPLGITVQDGTTGTLWRFAHRSSPVGGEFTTPVRTAPAWDFDCRDAEPVLPLRAAMEVGQNISFLHEGHWWLAVFHLGPIGDYNQDHERDPTYQFWYSPPGNPTAFTPLVTSIGADDLLLKSVTIPVSQYPRVDQPG